MANYTIYSLDGYSAFTMSFDKTENVKIKDLKEHLSEYYGVETNEVKLFIRISKTNKMIEKTDGNFFDGNINRYLFTLNPDYSLGYYDTIEVEDSIECLIKSTA